jgi:sialic acid synthase SpsE
MTEIIAEAGSNHNGSVARAHELVDLAARAGATSVKFQFIHADGLYVPAYFDGETCIENSVYHSRKAEELGREDWQSVWARAAEADIAISASVFDFPGLEMLSDLGAPYVKIASTDATNHDLIGAACSAFERVIVSTGMASLGEIDAMVGFVRANFPGVDLNLMHCVSSYPCPLDAANVQRVRLLRECFDVPVGYSDHTDGEVAACMSLVEGADFVEKHFTTDRALPGFDHAHAMEEEALAHFVTTLRDSARGLAQPANRSAPAEETTRIRARRGVYAARDLPAGHILTRDDLLHVRPSTGFEGPDLSAFLGARLEAPLRRYEPVGLRATPQGTTGNWQAARAYWDDEMTEKGMKTGDES